MSLASQGLRGLVAQGIDGNKAVFTPYTANFPPGSYTFVTPAPGLYKFALWGAGSGSGGAAASSAAYCEISRWLAYGDRVALVSGAHALGAGNASTVTFVDGKVVTAGGGNGGTPGVASGGDVNLDGSAAGVAGLGTGGGAAGQGGGAPAVLPYRGGVGGTGAVVATGAGVGTVGGATYPGGPGLIIVTRVR